MDDDAPSAKLLSTNGGYSQVYMVHDRDNSSKNGDMGEAHEVLFRCGNWAYRGNIQLNGGIKLNTTDLPLLIPVLQKQQGSLRYYCNASAVPVECDYYMPLRFLEDAVDFFATEMISETVSAEMNRMANVFSWIDEDDANTYFEMELGEVPAFMDVIPLIASKTYTRGLVIISIYSEQTLYFVVSAGEGDQALLDVKFPDVSRHGQGLHIASYSDPTAPFQKLTLWHAISAEVPMSIIRNLPKLKTSDVSSTDYQQTYCIMKSSWDETSPVLSVHHDVLFRFGSWCYAGRVQLTSTLNLEDVPLIIPALRMQQSRLDFLCDTRAVPTTSPFVGSLDFVSRCAPLLDLQLEQAGILLESMMADMQRNSPAEARQCKQWLEGDAADSFFELSLEHDSATKHDLHNIEMIASKCYHPSGVVTVSVFYQNSIYVTLSDGSSENPLLDSRFPDISKKSRGFQIQCFTEDDAPEHWPQLRKVQLWQRTDASADSKLPSRAAGAKSGSNGNDNGDDDGDDADADLDEYHERHLREGRDGDGWIQDDHRDGDAETSAQAKSSSSSSSAREPSSPTALVVHQEFPLADNNSDDPDSKNASASERIDVRGMASPDGRDRSERDLRNDGIDTTAAAADVVGTPDAKAGGTPDGLSAAADAKYSSPNSSGLASLSMDFAKSNSSVKAARPHHLPSMKLEGRLSTKMSSIRAGMISEDAKLGSGGLSAAPWDASGKPIGKPLGSAPLGAKPL
jgi:hypothetical protein